MPKAKTSGTQQQPRYEFRGFSPAARGHFKELIETKGVKVAFMGIDDAGRPVVCRVDQRNVQTYAIGVTGRGLEYREPIRQLNDDDMERVPQRDLELLCRLDSLEAVQQQAADLNIRA